MWAIMLPTLGGFRYGVVPPSVLNHESSLRLHEHNAPHVLCQSPVYAPVCSTFFFFGGALVEGPKAGVT